MVKAKKAKKDDDNPEQLSSKPDNSLFGAKKSKAADGEDGEAGTMTALEKKQKRSRPEVMKEDPIAQQLRAAKKQKKQEEREAAASSSSKSGGSGGGGGGSRRRPPRLRNPLRRRRLGEQQAVGAAALPKAEAAERERPQQVLELFDGKVLSVLQSTMRRVCCSLSSSRARRRSATS